MRVFPVIIACWLLAGCASQRPVVVAPVDSAEFKLPAETSFNPDAGRGNLLVVNLLVAGKERAFVVDTGAGITCVSASLAGKLGRPAGSVTANHFGERAKNRLFDAPAMYLGGARLRGGTHVMAMDLNLVSVACGQTIDGIVGVDVLTNYCVQIDFGANKLRFLDEAQADKSGWGRAFPMTPLNADDPRPAVAGNLLGEQGQPSLIDSGYLGAGCLMPKRFAQWTNQAAASAPETAHAPDGRFFGEAYPDVTLNRQDWESDGIGVDFLARHLVTLDFPKQTLYLKRTSVGPLPNVGGSAVAYLKSLKDRGLLPGWPKDGHGSAKRARLDRAANTVEVEAAKEGETAIYHYKVMRTAADGPWRLVKAWRTDAKGRVLEEYPVLK